jgi:hypothetical protein
MFWYLKQMFAGSKRLLLSYQILRLFVSISLDEKMQRQRLCKCTVREATGKKRQILLWLFKDNFYQKSFGYKGSTLYQF